MSAGAPSSELPAASTSSGTRAEFSTRRRSAKRWRRAAAMAIEPRQPPSQLIPKLQRALGGSAGWSGFVVQLLFVAALAWIAYEIVANASANLQAHLFTAVFAFAAY